MKRRNMTSAVCAFLAAALLTSYPGGMAALAGTDGAASGPGVTAPGPDYRSETSPRDPAAVPYNDLGSRRAADQDNALDGVTTAGLRRFSARSAAALLGGCGENRNYSPAGLYCSLALAAQGASGPAKSQLLALLGMPEQEAGLLPDRCGRVWRIIYQNNEVAETKLLGSMWLGEGDSLEASLRRTAEYQYYAHVLRTDLGDPAAPETMRRWLEGQTGRPVPALPAALPDNSFCLLGSVRYHDQWTYGFDAGKNIRAPFHAAGGQEPVCEYMTDQRNSSYYRGQGFLRASLTLRNRGTVTFILPDEQVSLDELLASPERVEEMFGATAESYGTVSWSVPKFQINSAVDAGPAVRALGAGGAFDAGTADFRAFTGGNLVLGSVIQESCLRLDESGVGPGVGVPEPLEQFGAAGEIAARLHLDRPFLYQVTVNQGVPLYTGICNNPSS